MKRALKWILILGGGLAVLVILALLLVPMFVDVESYKPVIEEKVSEATGRPFRLAGDLDLSLFPWAGFALSDLHLGNPPGFEREDLLYVKSFDVRVKLIPLISRDVQIKRFVLEGVQVNLEKTKDGRANWEGLGGEGAPGVPAEQAPAGTEAPSGAGLPLKSLAVGDFSVSGDLLYIDHAAETRKEISDLSLKLENVSLDRPINLLFSVLLDGKPLNVEGTIGPLGRDPMEASIPIDLRLTALEEVNLHMKGSVEAPGSARRFDLGIQIPEFSPRSALDAFGRELPIATSDPDVLERMSLDVRVAGTPEAVSLHDGLLVLDESRLTFSARAREFSRPDVAFDLRLDRIDLDRYLPPAGEEAAEKEKPSPGASREAEPIDYEPLRRLILDGAVRVGSLKAKGLSVRDIVITTTARDGVIRMDPLEAKLYEGSIQANAEADVRGKAPKSRFSSRLRGIQAGPLVRDLAGKDVIEGNVRGDISINTVGDRPEPIKQALNGKGDLLFQDGAVVGIDLAGMVRNVQSAFGMAESQAKSGDRPKTDFSELSAPFAIRNGVVETPGTELKSPFLRVVATGTADLVNEVLDLRVEPKMVATMKGQGDTAERSGIRVPVLVTGPFADPKFRPDLKSMIEGGLKEGVPDASQLKQMLRPGSDEAGDRKSESTEDQVKDQVKGLLKGFGVGQ
ncbi:MAG: AsmA family protein [Deltaproteobacteria bacterium]|nr:AsmA family protein [Deltaproteobacteria bacterium]